MARGDHIYVSRLRYCQKVWIGFPEAGLGDPPRGGYVTHHAMPASVPSADKTSASIICPLGSGIRLRRAMPLPGHAKRWRGGPAVLARLLALG